MSRFCTGESWVARPMSEAKFTEVRDPAFEAEWNCSMMGVSVPNLKQTRGTSDFHGSYNPRTETVNYTKPYLGLLLHELAHHICHVKGLNGRGNYHNVRFGEVLQELIDGNI
ncbi:hypothetical protein LCGC14_1214340 [marine sediment metagenome]|uniref:SprT-like domain-containing protein n=1 Tax=marine sediment metagenome TaxID=412755 RepID=A0A0F9PHV1_9ZZZZ